MYIVSVIPITKQIGKDTLTYFTKTKIDIGSVISIPVRTKSVRGIVVNVTSATEAKADIKKLSYNLKKIEKIHTSASLGAEYIHGAQKIADFYATHIGSVLSFLIPKAILESDETLVGTKKAKTEGMINETVLLQTDTEERFATYKSVIREEFAKGRSVFFCAPTTEDIQDASEKLIKGIEGFTYIMHGGITKKEIVERWKKIIAEEHPVLIIGSAPYVSIPRTDLGTIIVEKESSRLYKTQGRPFLDIRTSIEILAKEMRVRLILGDTLLRIETLWEEKNGKYAELSPLKFRSLATAESRLVSMKQPADMEKKQFTIIGDEVKKMLVRSFEDSEQTFLFCGRKGLFPSTVCSDCGTIVVCTNCKSPVVLYSKTVQGEKKRMFVCHHCGERRTADELCSHCGGWRLLPLGIGTDRVVEEIKTLFPDRDCLVMDTDHITTHKMAIKTRDAFYNTPGSIMVGTEMALTYLNQKIDNTAVVSIDSFFSIPDFRIHEKIFHILLSMRGLSVKQMLVQTRHPETKLFDYALRGNLVDFYRDEIEERKQVSLPPFGLYIKLTLVGHKTTIKKQMQEIEQVLAPTPLTIFDGFNPGSLEKSTIHGIIQLSKKDWVNTELLHKLKSLPPYCMIKIDPDTLL